jgi:hypothetical protein
VSPNARAVDSADTALETSLVEAPRIMPLTLIAPEGITCDGDSCAF